MGKTVGQLVRFGIVGFAATLVHVVVFLALTRGLAWNPTVATVPAFLTAFVCSYLLNHSWTFRVTGRHERYLVRYLTVALIGAALNAGIMHLVTSVLDQSNTSGLVAVVVIVPAFNFAGSRYWGFR